MYKTSLMLTVTTCLTLVAPAQQLDRVDLCPTLDAMHHAAFTLAPEKLGNNYFVYSMGQLADSHQTMGTWVYATMVNGNQDVNSAVAAANQNLKDLSNEPTVVSYNIPSSNSKTACLYATNNTIVVAAPIASQHK